MLGVSKMAQLCAFLLSKQWTLLRQSVHPCCIETVTVRSDDYPSCIPTTMTEPGWQAGGKRLGTHRSGAEGGKTRGK